MKTSILKLMALGLLAAAMVAAPAVARAQDTTNAPAVSGQAGPAKKAKTGGSLVFTGKLGAMDTNAMTFTVGKRTFDITSETKITRNGKPATLADGVPGETASGAYKKGADGKLNATSVSFITKAGGTGNTKKNAASESAGATTNSVTH